MNRVRLVSAATLTGFAVAALFVVATPIRAQQPPAPELHQVLAGKTFTPPVRGEAQIQVVWPPVTRRDKDLVVTKFTVKNISTGPIARLTIDEPWYDKGGAVVAGGKGVVTGLLQPNEVQTVTIETQYTPKMLSNNYQFSHFNGTIKVAKVAKLDVPKEAPAKPAGGKK
jgi:hypothetical protein